MRSESWLVFALLLFPVASAAVGRQPSDLPKARLAVPAHLRDSHYQGATQLGHGAEYQYSHDFPGGWSAQAYLPEDRRYHEPMDRGYEARIRQRLESLRALLRQASGL